MANTPTTPASVVSRLTDDEILKLAELCFFEDHSVEEDQKTADVLRDYVRTRNENSQLKARLDAVVKEIDKNICHPSESNCKRCGDHRGNCQCGSLSNNGMIKLLKFAKGE